MIITNPKTNETFESSFESFTESLLFLREKIRSGECRNSFAMELCSKSALSEAQKFWVNKLALDIVNPTAKPKPIGTENLDFSKVVTMVQHAFDNGAKRLKIRLLLDDSRIIALSPYAPSGTLIAVYVQDSQGYGERYGRIMPNGDFQPTYGTQSIDPMVKRKVFEFANDPLGVAKEYGIALGSCCFCAKTLSDERSIRLSYGPICARKYNLEVPY